MRLKLDVATGVASPSQTPVPLLGRNGDLFHFGMLAFGKGNGQHAILELSCRLIHFHSGR